MRAVNEAGLGGVWPDTVVLLRVDPAQGLAREDETDRISVEGVALQRRVADGYAMLAAAEPDRFVVVDAAAGIDTVVELVVRALGERW